MKLSRRHKVRIRIIMGLLIAFAFSSVSLFNVISLSPHTAEKGFNGPIIITEGGTYSGHWESKDSDVPAIDIRTSEPVIIEKAIIRGAGILIRSAGYGANITVKNTIGEGLPPTPYSNYEKPRRFLAVDKFKNIVIEHCYLKQTAGIYIAQEYVGNRKPENTIKIRYNKVNNIDGRIYDGIYAVQFVQFNFRNEVPHVEVAWNQIINIPDSSAVEDNINIYNSRGTSGSPMIIHDNYIQGAYPFPSSSDNYSGGGIITDSPGTDSTKASAHIKIYNNQLVGLGNYCLGIAGGNNIEIYNNRAIVAARFPDNSAFKCWTSGVWAKDYYKQNATYSNKIHHNVLAVVGQTGTWRNEIFDSTFVVAETFANKVLPSPVDLALEKQEYDLWEQKIQKANIKLGPTPINN